MSGHPQEAVTRCEACGIEAEPEPFDLNGPAYLRRACANEALAVLREVAGEMRTGGPRVQSMIIPARDLTRALVLYGQAELVATRTSAAVSGLLNTMPACRCSWEMKKRGPLWVCENWRPWNFWRHDLSRKAPIRRSPCM